MSNESTRTGSFPAITERPSPPPPPMTNTPEWFTWASRQIRDAVRDAAFARAGMEQLSAHVGRPPVAATKDPGSGMWVTLDEVRTTCVRVLAWTEAADRAAASGKGIAGRVGWKVVETLIPLGIGVFLLWLSGWHR